MNRRSFLAGATGAATLVGGIGSAQALQRRTADDGIRFQTFEVVDTDDGSEASIDVNAVGDGRVVTIEGVIQASDHCKRARLADATVADDTLHVTVETVAEKGAVCIQIPESFHYEAGFALDDGVSTVVVEHDSFDGLTERYTVGKRSKKTVRALDD